ncbi:MAG: hypothetical protein PHP54_00255 [Clostridia bacterium]|nr:hypothetical protein [Clostridia bacterium]
MKEGEIISKYKEIEKIYNIVDIHYNHIIVDREGTIRKIYLYQIFPVTIVNLEEDIAKKIIYQYREILKLIDFDFQILMSNTKFNVENYIHDLKIRMNNVNLKNPDISRKYIETVQKNLQEENIYDTQYYMIIVDKEESTFKDSIDNIIDKFTLIDCKVKRVDNEEEIGKILNFYINKERSRMEHGL